MKKIIKVLMVSFLLTTVLSGCGSKNADEFVGLDGKTITRPQKIERIISTAPSNTEILAGLGLADKIIAADSFSKQVAGISSKAKTIDFIKADPEALISLKPDVIFTSETNRVAGDNSLTAIEKAHIPVVYLPTPETYQEITKQIDFLAEFTDTKNKGNAILKQMDQSYQKIIKIAKKIPSNKVKKVYLEISGEPTLFTVGNKTFLNDFLKIVNAKNIFGTKDGWFQPNVENIVKENPDVIITTETFNPKAVKNILTRKDFSSIKAVKNKKVFAINQDLASRASQNSIKALEQLAKIIYPEYYE